MPIALSPQAGLRLAAGLRVAASCALLLFSACEKPGDASYTALMRYAVTDFRLVGIDARPVDPHSRLPLSGDQKIQLTALLLSTNPKPVELEWLDCPSYYYSDQGFTDDNIDCISTPRELRLGRGESTIYTYVQPSDLPTGPDRPPRPDPTADAGLPEAWDATLGDLEPPPPIAFDDAMIYLRATQDGKERFAQKSFLGLFMPDSPHPSLVSVSVDGEPRSQDQRQALVVHPGQTLRVEFSVLGLDESIPVQWFVTQGTLSQRGLTLYDSVEPFADGETNGTLAKTHNVWTIPEQLGPQQLMAVVGGNFGVLPWMRLRVEVQP